MSSKKDKLLESAQKFILKGQLDRAIKDYEQIVALDPNDIRHRQRLAELMVRVNRKQDAIGEYEAIGKYYADNSYYLKAIAVYKQLQKLDPDNIQICLNLARLNEKQDLTGNALAEYSRVYSHYEKMRRHAEALSVLESMLAIEPDNLNTRLKFAETRFASGSKEQALQDFIQVALILKEQGDQRAFAQVGERIAYLFPGTDELTLRVATSQLEKGDAASAIVALKEIARKDGCNLTARQLLAKAMRATGEREGARVVLLEAIRLFPYELPPVEQLIQSAVEDRDPDYAISLLKAHQSLFVEKGASTFLERTYLSLLELMPEEKRLKLGLKELYKAAGEEAKPSGISEEMEGVEEEEEPEELELDLSEELSLSTEEGAKSGLEAPPAVEVAPLGEVALELELSDRELVDLEELHGQEGKEGVNSEDDEEVNGELPLELELAEEEYLCGEQEEEMPCLAQPPSGSPGFAAPEVQVSEEVFADFQSDEAGEHVELEVEITAEMEAIEAASAEDFEKYSLDGFSEEEPDQLFDEEDTETNYNLGIAFKEMGMYDKAIAEFMAAAANPRRKVDSLTLQGVCCRDKGDAAGAEEVFRRGLALQGLAIGEYASIKYELAILYESEGREWDALLHFREIEAVCPGFRDTAEKIAGFEEEGEYKEDLDDLVELDGEIEWVE